MKHVAPFLLFFLTLWWLWQLLSGEWSGYEWIAGAAAAAVAAVLAELAVSRTEGRAAVPRAALTGVPSALAMVFVDFVLVMRALVHRQRGVLRETPFAHPDAVPYRAWVAIVADWSPNAYIVDIDEGRTLSHHVLPNDRSQSPA